MTAILYMLGGGVAGAIVSVLLYVLGFGVEFINCACQIITCNCDGGDAIPGLWESGSFGSICLFCSIGGAVIGLLYGIYKMKAEADEEAAKRNAANSEEARKQRIQWAGEVKKKALSVESVCSKNKTNYKQLVSTTYKGNDQMKDVLNELTKAAELQGKVNAIADKVVEKEESQNENHEV